MRKRWFTLILSVLAMAPLWAADPPAKAPIRVSEDGFPSGSVTPEGAACDLARAFIRRNGMLFMKVCMPPFGAPESKDAYQDFLDKVVGDMTKGEAPANGPKKLAKCFAARHLSKDGPASYGSASFGFQDVMFVDVGVFLEDNQPQLCRTQVIKTKDGKWMALPRPGLYPLLSTGMNQEGPSQVDFSEAYTVE
ncbi:hypothetical protein BH09VER1_BH09VER1_27110 [soil metagenome]